jgi:trans-aconitate methyltransferase
VSTETLKRTWDSANLKAQTLREIMLKKAKENMEQCESKERDLKE